MERQLLMNCAGDDFDFDKTFLDFEYEGSSSGYESSDFSDVESISSAESHDSVDINEYSKNNLLPIDDREEVMNFQSTHALSEHLKLILAMPEMCDVTFLVGPLETPVHGVRAIMGTRSRVLYQLLRKHMAIHAADEERKTKRRKSFRKSKKSSDQAVGIGRSLSERLTIPVKKYDSEVFRLLIQFVHCGSATITEDTAAGLYCAAVHFELPDLARACLDFAERCLKAGRAEAILFSARCYSYHRAAKALFDKIYSILDRRYIATLEETAVKTSK